MQNNRNCVIVDFIALWVNLINEIVVDSIQQIFKNYKKVKRCVCGNIYIHGCSNTIKRSQSA